MMLSRARKAVLTWVAKSLADPSDMEFGSFAGHDGTRKTVRLSSALRVPAVSAAIRTISEAAATLDLHVIRNAGGKEQIDTEHHVAKMLRGDVSEWLSGFELVRDLIAQALVDDKGGRAWVNWVNGRPVEVIHFRPGVIDVDESRDTREPLYRIGAREEAAQNIIHVRGPFEKAPLTLAAEAVGLAITLETFGRSFFENGARPSGVVLVKKSLGLKGLKNFQDWFRAQHATAAKTGMPIVLDEDMDWKSFDLTSSDSQYLDLRRFQIEEIGRAFNLPVTFLGDLTRATWSNLESKNREFLSYSLEPWLRSLEVALTRALFTPEERATLSVRVDRDDLTRVSLLERTQAGALVKQAELGTTNDVRPWLGMLPSADPAANILRNPNTTSRAALPNGEGDA
jgi:HK97 family phage portal protein